MPLPTLTVARLPVSPKQNHRRVGSHWYQMLHDASTQHVSIVFWSRSFLGDPRCVPGAASNSINNAWKLCRRGSQLWKFAVQPTFNATLFGCRIQSRQTWHFSLKPKRTLKPRLLDVMSHRIKIIFFNFNFLFQFQLMKIIIQFVRRVLIPDSLPGSAASHFSTSQSTDSFRSQNTCSCSHGKSCISSIRSEGTAMCSAPVLRGKLWENGKVQKGVESEKKTLQGNVEFVKAASFQTQKTQKLDIKIDIQNIQDVFHLQRLVSFLWRGKHHRWNCWRRVRVGETPRYTVFYICRPRSGRAEGEVAELTVQFCCKQISKSQCIMLYDALCIYAMFWRISKSREILAKFW